MLLLNGICTVYFAKFSQGRTKYNIDPARFVAVLIDRGQPPLDASRKAPCGYWFLVAASLSGCSRPSDKYVLAVYNYWRSNRGDLHTLLGNMVFYQSALTYVCFLLHFR